MITNGLPFTDLQSCRLRLDTVLLVLESYKFDMVPTCQKDSISDGN